MRFKTNEVFIHTFLTACYTGMRTGEVLALTWDDIDLKEKTIRINKTVYAKNKDEKGRWFLGTTKTEGSCREIYLCDTLINILKKYRDNQLNNQKKNKKNYHNYYLEEVKNKYGKVTEYRIVEFKHKSKSRKIVDLVFVKENGIYSGTDVIRYPYKIIHNELNINCRFYDLRGSFATKCLRNGVEIKDIAKVLGHTRIETTENYYIGCTSETIKNVTRKFENNTDLKLPEEI